MLIAARELILKKVENKAIVRNIYPRVNFKK